MMQGNQFQSAFFFFKKKKALYQVRASGVLLAFTIFRQPSSQHTIETTCLKICTIDPEICSISIFQIRLWEQFLQHIFCMIFQQKCSSRYILLTDQISLPGCLHFLTYWTVCVLQLIVYFIYFSFLININLMEKNSYSLTITLYKLN